MKPSLIPQRTYEAVADITVQDTIDKRRAERANRIVNSEVWQKDFLPMLTELYMKYLDDVKTKDMDPDTLKVFDDILAQVDGAIQLGAKAMKLMANRRLKNAELLIKD